MKTFTAEELNKSPAKVYREVDKNGGVLIAHARYPDIDFVLLARPKEVKEEKKRAKIAERLNIKPKEVEEFKKGRLFDVLVSDFDKEDLLALLYRYATYNEGRL